MIMCKHKGLGSKPTIELLLVGGWLAGESSGEGVVAHRRHQRAERVHRRDALHVGAPLTVHSFPSQNDDCSIPVKTVVLQAYQPLSFQLRCWPRLKSFPH